MGYFVYLCNTSYSPDLERKYVKTLLDQNLDGIIVAYGLIDEGLYEMIVTHDIPLVLINSHAEIKGEVLPSVQVDNIKGSIITVEHLKNIGAKRICYASEPLFNATAQERYQGFLNAVEKFGYEGKDVRFLIEQNFADKLELGYNIGTQIILDGEIDGVYATSDYLAFGIIERIRDYDPKMLEKIAIMGFDNINLCSLFSPKLTTIAQPMKRICEKSIELILKLIDGEILDEKRFILEPSIIIRDSTFLRFDS